MLVKAESVANSLRAKIAFMYAIRPEFYEQAPDGLILGSFNRLHLMEAIYAARDEPIYIYNPGVALSFSDMGSNLASARLRPVVELLAVDRSGHGSAEWRRYAAEFVVKLAEKIALGTSGSTIVDIDGHLYAIPLYLPVLGGEPIATIELKNGEIISIGPLLR